jgi:hypothetical protein
MIARIILCICLVVSGCQIAPQTPKQYFAAVYQSIGAAADSIATLTEAGKLQPDQAIGYIDQLDKAKSFTDEGRKVLQCRDAIKTGENADAKCGPASTADSRAALARGIINQIQQALSGK